jgi:hypothetical protein
MSRKPRFRARTSAGVDRGRCRQIPQKVRQVPSMVGRSAGQEATSGLVCPAALGPMGSKGFHIGDSRGKP